MNRILLGLGGVGMMIVVAVGCSSDDDNKNNNGNDSGVADTGTDTKPVVTDTGVKDTGNGIPTCYNQEQTDEQILEGASNSAEGFGYHPAMAIGSGCSEADITAYTTALESDTFKSPQLSTATIAGLSATCKSCLGAEFAQPRATAAEKAATKWGVSGLWTNAALTQYDLPSNRSFFNWYGCTEAKGVLTGAEAKAISDLETCLDIACPTSQDGSACGASGSTKQRACITYATTKGACTTLQAAGAAAATKAQSALVAGECGDVVGLIKTFCPATAGDARDGAVN